MSVKSDDWLMLPFDCCFVCSTDILSLAASEALKLDFFTSGLFDWLLPLLSGGCCEEDLVSLSELMVLIGMHPWTCWP